jgi:hypothetical protein
VDVVPDSIVVDDEAGSGAGSPSSEPPVAARATPTLKATTRAGSSMSFSAVLMKSSFPLSVAYFRG